MDEDWPEFTISELHEIDILVEEERNKELIQEEEREKANKENKKKRFAALPDEELDEMGAKKVDPSTQNMPQNTKFLYSTVSKNLNLKTTGNNNTMMTIYKAFKNSIILILSVDERTVSCAIARDVNNCS